MKKERVIDFRMFIGGRGIGLSMCREFWSTRTDVSWRNKEEGKMNMTGD